MQSFLTEKYSGRILCEPSAPKREIFICSNVTYPHPGCHNAAIACNKRLSSLTKLEPYVNLMAYKRNCRQRLTD